MIQNNSDKEVKKYQRNHSFSKRPSFRQVFGILTFLIEALIFYIYIVGSYQKDSLKISMICVFTVSFFGLLLFSIITGQIDSTDEILIALKNGDTDKISNLGEKQSEKLSQCTICKVIVRELSRHCSTCQRYMNFLYRCCDKLDHHCAWLNICIGAKNYKHFMATTIFAFFNLVTYLVGLALLTEQISRTTMTFKCFGFVIAWIFGFVVLVFMVLIFNLILFHIYLNYNGISTYLFITMQKMAKINRNANVTREKHLARENQIINDQTSKVALNEDQASIQNPKHQIRIMGADKQTKPQFQHDFQCQIQPVPIHIHTSLPVQTHLQTYAKTPEYKSESHIKNLKYVQILQKINIKKDDLSVFFSKNPTLSLFLGAKQCKQSVEEIITIFNSRSQYPQQKHEGEQQKQYSQDMVQIF